MWNSEHKRVSVFRVALPPLDARGLLPVGIHSSSWNEIEAAFCWNDHRATLFRNLRQFVQIELPNAASALALYLGGSFFSDKILPADIEATLAVPPEFFSAGSAVDWLTSLGSPDGHERIMQNYRLDFYITLDFPGFRDFRDFFQYVGEETAAAKGLNAKDRRGVVRVTEWATG